MKVRIKSNGITTGTSIVAVAEDGTETPMHGVLGVTWSASVDSGHSFATAVLTLEGVEVDVVGEVTA